jgi:hypothetical protein
VIAVTVVVAVGLVVMLFGVGVLLKRLFGGVTGAGDTGQAPDSPPYGALPGLGPVGSLGELSPNADINDPNASPDDLLGH